MSPRATAVPWRASTATPPLGRSHSRLGVPAAWVRRDGRAPTATGSGARPCADGHGLSLAAGVAVSPDGKTIYVASWYSNAVARFDRKKSGAITQPAGSAGCVSETGVGPCADGHGLYAPAGVAVSPDGLSVYVASYDSDGVARLDRDTSSGAIAQPAGTVGCISDYGTRYGTGP